jgi:hypothetical protein
MYTDLSKTQIHTLMRVMVRLLGSLRAIVQLSLVGVHFLTLQSPSLSTSMIFSYFCNIQNTSSNSAMMFHRCDFLASLMLNMSQALG